MNRVKTGITVSHKRLKIESISSETSGITHTVTPCDNTEDAKVIKCYKVSHDGAMA
jgi:hypothetical protein